MPTDVPTTRDPVEEWVDHTNASPFEEFVAGIEHVLLDWGLGKRALSDKCWPASQQTVVKSHTLKFNESHSVVLRWCTGCLDYDVQPICHADQWQPTQRYPTTFSHDFGKWFGVTSFLLLFPLEFGRDTHSFLDPSIATTLRSALNIAQVNIGCAVPGFVPALQKNAMCFLGCATHSNRTDGVGEIVRFHVDSKPVALVSQTRLDGLLRLFRSKVMSSTHEMSTTSEISITIRHSWTTESFEQPILSPNRFSADDIGWAKWTDSDVSWRMDRQSTPFFDSVTSSQIQIRLQRLQGPSGAPLWGPLQEPLRAITVTAIWPSFDESSFPDAKVNNRSIAVAFPPDEAPQWCIDTAWHGFRRASVLELMRSQRGSRYGAKHTGISGEDGNESWTSESDMDPDCPLAMSLKSIVLLFEDALALPRDTLLCGIHESRDGTGITDSTFDTVEHMSSPSSEMLQKHTPKQQRKRDMLGATRVRDAIAFVVQEAMKPPIHSSLKEWKTRQINEMVQELFTVQMKPCLVHDSLADNQQQLQRGKNSNSFENFSMEFEREMQQDLDLGQLTTSREMAREDRVKQINRLLHDGSPEIYTQSYPYTPASKSLPKASPAGSLLSVLAIRFVSEFTSLADVAVLWNEIVKELRWHWEHLVPIPVDVNTSVGVRNPLSLATQAPDFRYCLLHQNLQLLNCCILLEHMRTSKSNDDESDSNVSVNSDEFFDAQSEMGSTASRQFLPSQERIQQLVVRPVPYFEGFDFDQQLAGCKHPVTRASVLMTETMSNDEEQVAELMRNTSSDDVKEELVRNTSSDDVKEELMRNTSSDDVKEELMRNTSSDDVNEEQNSSMNVNEQLIQLAKNAVTSDIQAFKAANPDNQRFELFMTWATSRHPRFNSQRWAVELLGKHESSMLNELWMNTKPVPLYHQHTFMHHGFAGEAEKCLHHLETISPRQLLGQLVPVAFHAADFTLQTAESQAIHNTDVQRQLNATSESIAKVCQCTLLHHGWFANQQLSGVEQTPDNVQQLRTQMDAAVSHVHLAEDLIVKSTSLLHKFPVPVAEQLISSIRTPSPPQITGKQLVVSSNFHNPSLRNMARDYVYRNMPRVAERASGLMTDSDDETVGDAVDSKNVPAHQTEVLLHATCNRSELETGICMSVDDEPATCDSGSNRMYCLFSGLEFRLGLATSSTS